MIMEKKIKRLNKTLRELRLINSAIGACKQELKTLDNERTWKQACVERLRAELKAPEQLTMWGNEND
jgi:septal ring factor EnvC (AmiA/AmiB activator)